MIKLKDILFKNTAPGIFVPRRLEDRVERLIKNYIRNGNKGNLKLSDMELTELPIILKNIDIEGNFNCANNKLTSLINAPKYIGGYFSCANNKLTSLNGCPKYVGEHFNCSDNNLTSLDGCPKYVGGDFHIMNNPGKFLTEQIRAVCDVQGAIFVGGYDKA